jgi:hypothetical protein
MAVIDLSTQQYDIAVVPRDERERGRVLDIFEKYRRLLREVTALQRRLAFAVIKGGLSNA